MKTIGKVGFCVIVLALLLFSGIATYVAKSMASMMEVEARRMVQSVVRTTVLQINQLMSEVEVAVRNSVWIVSEHLDTPDYMYGITRQLVENNAFIVGSAIAFEPDFFPGKGRLFSPYSCVASNNVVKSFPLPYEYHRSEWYAEPRRLGQARWCEPYFDEGGGETLMSTYSVPIRDSTGRIYAVMTSDISLDRLTRHVAAICPYPQSYAVMRSEKGEYLVPPPKDPPKMDQGAITIREKADNGWSVEVVCPIAEIVRGSRRLVRRMTGFAVAGLLLILAVSWLFANRLQRMMVARQRIESELATARSIQSGILQKNFPYSVAANIRPAREVGGDLYDFVERNGLWYFIVGDASGKGVPAALFSFMAGTAFRLACNMGLSPVEIVRHINSVLTDGNDMSMFVTAFVGVLDRDNETLEYCNAGHNPPLVALDGAEAKFLDVKKNLPLGVKTDCPYVAQRIVLTKNSRLVVYTDGVTEAERVDHSQFGEKRLVDFVMAHREDDAAKLMKGICREVDSFADGAEQSDDITVMVIES